MIKDFAPARHNWAMPLCTLFFLCTLFWSGHGGDLGYWSDWMASLSQGYEHIHANYPPLLLHWFWLLAQLFDLLHLEYPPASPVQLKFFVLLPVLATQLWLCRQVELLLAKRGIEPLRSPIFWGVVASPALLLDGPVWGQVDLLPFLPMWVSLVCAFRARFFSAGAAFALALVWKFQAIVILPVLAGLFMHRWRLATWHYAPQALAGFLLVGFVAFLPFIWVGRFQEMFNAAYLGNTSIFPLSTMNAANLWFLLAGNNTDMLLPLIEGAAWASPHKLGLGLFLLVSVMCMVRAWRGCRGFGEVIGIAMVMILGFFTVAPSMHERYLFLMVPLAALGCARGYFRSAWLHLANLMVALNILLVLPLTGHMVWQHLSWLVVGVALAALLVFVLPGARIAAMARRLLYRARQSLPALAMPHGGALAALMVLAFTCTELYQLHRLNHPAWDERGRLYLSDYRELSVTQQWGHLSRDRAVNDDPLDIFGHRFAKGLGVHAFSQVEFRIPEGARYFHSFYGLNRSGENGRVRFRILLDGKSAWQSGAIGWQAPGEVVLPVSDAETLTLQVHGMGSIISDHANWAEAGFWQGIPERRVLTMARR
ncbi:NPCBM/NEW2 domain-containing protein [Microbulbifer bruguierae]|uniref:NPCBM/NEW2 domain-containing protein n=1 Tax=Microbulbifer bruguierae TaxID=3029061 RepID=A0ABY8N9V8_9GAMM|nr:NPCBM/NEW2 domain-containing protein [Microbulbifer bruguierae]WGL15568.1 NPCBM/NEW2 domain-containing protein [Microbulbifer bruguierae]